MKLWIIFLLVMIINLSLVISGSNAEFEVSVEIVDPSDVENIEELGVEVVDSDEIIIGESGSETDSLEIIGVTGSVIDEGESAISIINFFPLLFIGFIIAAKFYFVRKSRIERELVSSLNKSGKQSLNKR